MSLHTIVADESHTWWERLNQLLVESACHFYALECSVDDQDAVQCSASTLLDEFGAALGLRLDESGVGGEAAPRFGGAVVGWLVNALLCGRSKDWRYRTRLRRMKETSIVRDRR